MVNRNNPNNNDEDKIAEELIPELFPKEWYNHMDKVIDKTLSLLDMKFGHGKYDVADVINKIINHNVTKRLDEVSAQLVEELPLPSVLDWTESSFDEIFDDVHCLVDAFSMKNMKLHKFFIHFGDNVNALRHYFLWRDCINEEYANLHISERTLPDNKILCTIRKVKNEPTDDKN